jgi:hypothetical protein
MLLLEERRNRIKFAYIGMALVLAALALTGATMGTQYVSAWHHGHYGHHGGYVSGMVLSYKHHGGVNHHYHHKYIPVSNRVILD